MEKCKYCIYKDENGTYLKGKCTCPQLPNITKCIIVSTGQKCSFFKEEKSK